MKVMAKKSETGYTLVKIANQNVGRRPKTSAGARNLPA